MEKGATGATGGPGGEESDGERGTGSAERSANGRAVQICCDICMVPVKKMTYLYRPFGIFRTFASPNSSS